MNFFQSCGDLLQPVWKSKISPKKRKLYSLGVADLFSVQILILESEFPRAFRSCIKRLSHVSPNEISVSLPWTQLVDATFDEVQ